MNKQIKAIFPASFDPIHKGHIDIIKRAIKDYGDIEILVANNDQKQNQTPLKERYKRVKEVLKKYDVKISFLEKGLVANYAKKQNVKILIRGYRNKKDLVYENKMALFNKNVNNELETIFYKTKIIYKFLSSSKIKLKK